MTLAFLVKVKCVEWNLTMKLCCFESLLKNKNYRFDIIWHKSFFYNLQGLVPIAITIRFCNSSRDKILLSHFVDYLTVYCVGFIAAYSSHVLIMHIDSKRYSQPHKTKIIITGNRRLLHWIAVTFIIAHRNKITKVLSAFEA